MVKTLGETNGWLIKSLLHKHGSLNASLQLTTEDSTDEWWKNKTTVVANFPECNIWTPLLLQEMKADFNLQCPPCPEWTESFLYYHV